MAKGETPGYGVGTPWLGGVTIGGSGDETTLGTAPSALGVPTVPAAGDDRTLGLVWGGPDSPEQEVPDTGTELPELTGPGLEKTSVERSHGLGIRR